MDGKGRMDERRWMDKKKIRKETDGRGWIGGGWMDERGWMEEEWIKKNEERMDEVIMKEKKRKWIERGIDEKRMEGRRKKEKNKKKITKKCKKNGK